jgi:WD40 repeat protein
MGRVLPTNDGKRIAFIPFHHDGKRDRIAVMDVATRKLLWGRSPHELVSGYALKFSLDHSTLFVGDCGPEVHCFDVPTGRWLGSWAATPDGKHKLGFGLPDVGCLALSPDGEYVAAAITGSGAGDVYVRSLRKKTMVRLVHGTKYLVEAIAFSPDSKNLASMDEKSICIWSKRIWE